MYSDNDNEHERCILLNDRVLKVDWRSLVFHEVACMMLR